jgi:hypothetical protein
VLKISEKLAVTKNSKILRLKMELLNYSQLSVLNGKASFKLGDIIYELEFIHASDTNDGEEPQFWQLIIKGSNSASV